MLRNELVSTHILGRFEHLENPIIPANATDSRGRHCSARITTRCSSSRWGAQAGVASAASRPFRPLGRCPGGQARLLAAPSPSMATRRDGSDMRRYVPAYCGRRRQVLCQVCQFFCVLNVDHCVEQWCVWSVVIFLLFLICFSTEKRRADEQADAVAKSQAVAAAGEAAGDEEKAKRRGLLVVCSFFV